jgi:hypothetical protein
MSAARKKATRSTAKAGKGAGRKASAANGKKGAAATAKGSGKTPAKAVSGKASAKKTAVAAPKDGRTAAPALPRGSTDYARRPAPMNASFPGTPMSGRDFYGGGVITWDDQYEVEYDWDAGVAISAYLEGLKHGKLLASYSPGSDRTVVPPRTFDELSWTPIDDVRELPGTGTVNTFSLCMVNWDASRRAEPLLPAVIELDGASPGQGILHMLDEVDPDDIEIGMRVEAVWKPADEREGAITDIRYFRPLMQRARAKKAAKTGGKR